MITLTDEKVSIIHFKRICKVKSQEIQIELNQVFLMISGDDLVVAYLNADEIILRGKIKKVDFEYHDERL